MSSTATFGTVPSLAAAGDAYVSGFKVKEQKDGVGPFDKDDDAGNDSSDDNLIVRSFDDIKLHARVHHGPHGRIPSGRGRDVNRRHVHAADIA